MNLAEDYSTENYLTHALFTHFSLIDPFPSLLSLLLPFCCLFPFALFGHSFTVAIHTHCKRRHLQADDDRCQKVRPDDQLTLGQDYALTDARTGQPDAELGRGKVDDEAANAMRQQLLWTASNSHFTPDILISV